MYPVHPITLSYPADWFSPAHPAGAEARRDAESWLRGLGVIDSELSARKFAAMNPASYAALPFSSAPPAELVTITRFITLWSFYDESVEGKEGNPAQILAKAVRGEPREAREENPFLRGLWEIGRRCRETMSERWLSRHAERFADWVRSVDDEARLVARARSSGRTPSLAAYMAVREINIGVLPMIDFVEYAAGRELSERVLADPDRDEAEGAAAHIVIWQNDLFGLGRDLEDAWPNAVASAAPRAGALAEGAERVGELHAASVARLAAASDRLIRRHGDAARFWVEGLLHVVTGFARWHVETPRYSASCPLPSGETIELTIAAGAAFRPAAEAA